MPSHRENDGQQELYACEWPVIENIPSNLFGNDMV